MHMNGLFQNAYVTRNLDKAVAELKGRHAVGEVMVVDWSTDVITPQGHGPVSARIALAWVGNVQIEVIQPISGLVQIYTDALPADDSLRFHHVGMRVPHMEALRSEAAEKGWPVVFQGGGDGFRCTYVDARDTLGHYVEYVEIRQDIWEATGGR